jgi:hypothetical protein
MEAIYRPIQMTFREPIIIAVNLYIGMSLFLEQRWREFGIDEKDTFMRYFILTSSLFHLFMGLRDMILKVGLNIFLLLRCWLGKYSVL